MVGHLRDVRIGDPADATTTMGPLIREVQRARVERYVQSGIDQGATVAFGGGRPDLSRGYYVEPTLFTDAKNSMAIGSTPGLWRAVPGQEPDGQP